VRFELNTFVGLRSAFEWLDVNLPGSVALRESLYGFPVLLTAHVLAICLFLGLVIMMDLRLVGIGNRHLSFTDLQRALFPWQMLGMALASMTGIALFYAQPLHYFGKGFFWLKMALMIVAAVNALAFHNTTYQSAGDWDRAATVPPGAARAAGVISLAVWGFVVVFGRLVAYNWFTYE
jgi:hypothetical protein